MRLEDLEEIDSWDWPDGAEDALADALEDPRSPDRAVAVRLAGMLYSNDRVAKALAALLQDRTAPPELRANAAVALGPSLESCEDELNDFDEEISAETFELALQAVEAVWRDRVAPAEVRRRALESAARAWRPWVEEAVREALASSPEWRLSGVYAAGYHMAFRPVVLEALGAPELDLRVEAARALGRTGEEEDAQRLLKLVRRSDTPRPLLLACIEALGGIGGSAAIAALDELSESEDEEIADAAADAHDEASMMAAVARAFDDEDFDDEE
jgi:HEAT repeat protein